MCSIKGTTEVKAEARPTVPACRYGAEGDADWRQTSSSCERGSISIFPKEKEHACLMSLSSHTLLATFIKKSPCSTGHLEKLSLFTYW